MELGVSRYTTSIFPSPSPAWCYFPSFGSLQPIKECSIFSTLFLHELLVSSSHGLPVSSCSCPFFVSTQKMQTQTNPLWCKKLNKISKTQIKNVRRDSLALPKIEALKCKKCNILCYTTQGCCVQNRFISITLTSTMVYRHLHFFIFMVWSTWR